MYTSLLLLLLVAGGPSINDRISLLFVSPPQALTPRMGLGIASPSHAHGGGRHGRRHSKEATTAMRARQLFIVLLALLSPRWQCQCFHLSWSLGQRDADRRFRSTTLVMGGENVDEEFLHFLQRSSALGHAKNAGMLETCVCGVLLRLKR